MESNRQEGTMKRIVLVDPPFAYARQMVIEDPDTGERVCVPYDQDAIDAQREREQ
jgi:hypothetical protein